MDWKIRTIVCGCCVHCTGVDGGCEREGFGFEKLGRGGTELIFALNEAYRLLKQAIMSESLEYNVSF